MVTLPRACNGPPDSGHGGWTAGAVAAYVGPSASVSLRALPPLGRPLAVERDGEVVRLCDGETVVAEARPAEVTAVPPRPVGADEAEAGRAAYLAEVAPSHPFPTCFGCGPAREVGEALRVFAGPVPSRDLVAAPWEVTDVLGLGEVTDALVWAALDCPTGMAFSALPDWEAGRPLLLANLAIDVRARPSFGDTCVATAWVIDHEGRKWRSAGALTGPAGELLAVAEALWIEPRPA